MRKFLEFVESGFTVLALLLYSEGLFLVLKPGSAISDTATAQPPDTSLIRLVFTLIYAITFFLLIVRWKKVVYVASRDLLIWLLVGLAVVSVLWSFAPDLTLRRIIALMGTSFFGIYLATRYTLKEQLQILGWTFGIAIILSVLFGIALPQYGIMSHPAHLGSWRGIYTHKNGLGKNMVLSAIIFFLLLIEAKKNRLVLGFGFSFSIILLLLCTSKSSLINLIVIFIALVVYKIFWLRYRLMVLAFIAIVMVGGSLQLLIVANADTLLGLFGRDATFTGRLPLWQFALHMVHKQPWLGYGYNIFWDLDFIANYTKLNLKWTPVHAHNGFVQILVDLGWVGLGTFFLGFGRAFLRGIFRVRREKTSEFLWTLLFLTYYILANLGEHTMLARNNIFWVLYVAVLCSLGIPPKNKKNKEDIDEFKIY